MKQLVLILIGWLVLCLEVNAQTLYTVKYWFDGRFSECISNSNTTGIWQTQLDVNHLSEGLHSINIIVCDDSNNWSSPLVYFFYKSSIDSLTYTYWFDNDINNPQIGNANNGQLFLNVDSLSDGFHFFNVQIGKGCNTILKSWIFLKVPTTNEIEDSTCLQFVYMIDGLTKPSIPINANSGLVHLDIDVGNLSTGIHTIDYFINSPYSSMTNPQRAFFYSGNEGIVKYEWWLNDNDSNKHATRIEHCDTFQLVTMLAVDSFPICPSRLHLATDEYPPVIYAKNEVHFRFWNNRPDFVQIDKQYVDYSVSDTVYADTIERNSQKIVATPIENEIRWFKLGVSVGDSMAFMTDRACSMQLYSPTGEVIYSATGIQSLSFDGCHAFFDGVYYLAVHTANISGGDSLTIHYKHIEKYALLSFSPNEFGNLYGSRFNIQMIGNGFDKLDSVFLIRGSDTIKTHCLQNQYRTAVTASFIINDSIANGVYNLMLFYSDSTGIFSIYASNAVNLNEINYGNIFVSIQGPVGEIYPAPISIVV